ncbi:ferredoxin [Monoraphidium neglectum]|uniref:Ferredoxin n=1 Tax=Monoraphidium neglectum TaxID=145388 RepID=A0A0D2LWF2_9CHLO|nr:ferredoxin [Monoraphidium neglectum]KIY93881.1 ferredoxin [Monoraphidium neglectum]|eukprot:XP_013892901.1 ferredoxin [Monoraphidium neglectum]
MVVYFTAEDVVTEAMPGDVIMEVAGRCGITIPGGCYSGNCGICEVEVRKFADGQDGGSSGSGSSSGGGGGAVVRSCIARLPPGYARVEIDALQDDQIWGLDGFDT